MKEPRYIVYVLTRGKAYYLDIIRWSDRGIWETTNKIRIRKRLTSGMIDKIVPHFISPQGIIWRGYNSVVDGIEAYEKMTLDNMTETLERLEDHNISYLYCVYERA